MICQGPFISQNCLVGDLASIHLVLFPNEKSFVSYERTNHGFYMLLMIYICQSLWVFHFVSSIIISDRVNPTNWTLSGTKYDRGQKKGNLYITVLHTDCFILTSSGFSM